MQRKTIYNSETAKDCIAKIDELNGIYKRKFNRNSKVDLFYAYSHNSTGQPLHEISAYYELIDKDEVTFFENLLNN